MKILLINYNLRRIESWEKNSLFLIVKVPYLLMIMHFELSDHFIDDGDKFFEIVSRYDDVLADVLKRQGYNAGGTLKLILPFLKAYGVTNQQYNRFFNRKCTSHTRSQ